MIEIRHTRPEDASGVVDVQRRAFRDSPDMKIWSEAEIRTHLEVYPEGQFVAIDVTRNGLIVGACTSMRTTSELALRPHTWREVTGGSLLPNHDPEGDILYGVDVSVRPAYRSRGVGRKLYDARIDLLKRTDCEGFAAGGRIPNYHHFAKYMSAEEYVALVEKRLIRDPVLGFQLSNGMVVKAVMKGYLSDTSSLGHATLIYLPNPAKHPSPKAEARSRKLPDTAPGPSASSASSAAHSGA